MGFGGLGYTPGGGGGFSGGNGGGIGGGGTPAAVSNIYDAGFTFLIESATQLEFEVMEVMLVTSAYSFSRTSANVAAVSNEISQGVRRRVAVEEVISNGNNVEIYLADVTFVDLAAGDTPGGVVVYFVQGATDADNIPLFYMELNTTGAPASNNVAVDWADPAVILPLLQG